MASKSISSSSGILSNIDYLTISLGSKEMNPTDINQRYYIIQCWLGVATVIIWLISFFAVKYFQMVDIFEYDNDTKSASDYSVSIEGFPMEITQEELQKQLNTYFQSITGVP